MINHLWSQDSHENRFLTFDPKPHISPMLYKYDLATRKWTQLRRSRLATYMHSSAMYKNMLLHFGGVTFDGSSDQLEISNQLRCFDVERNEWMERSGNGDFVFRHRHRYAHSSFVYQEHLYIFAGFNGFFLEDLFKVNLGSLFAPRVNRRQVIYPTNGNGPVFLHPPLKSGPNVERNRDGKQPFPILSP